VRAVLDTNVVISAIFFGGLPRQILSRWIDGGFELCLSPAIFDEYLRVCDRLAVSRPGLEYRELLAAILGHATLVSDDHVAPGTTADPDDDKFMGCAKEAGAVVVSGDRHLLDAAGWSGIEVLTPRQFLTRCGEPDG
jgi:putative PIN family toxin of toxin-antitoxin system